MLQLKVSDEDDYAEVISGPGREPRPHHTPVAQPNREANYVAIDHRANKLNQQRPDAWIASYRLPFKTIWWTPFHTDCLNFCTVKLIAEKVTKNL